MTFTKTLAILSISVAGIFAGTVQAQQNMVCNTVKIDRGNGDQSYTGKSFAINVGAATLKTQTETFVGNGQENVNGRGERYYAYNNPRNGDSAVLIFTKEVGVALISGNNSVMLKSTCAKV